MTDVWGTVQWERRTARIDDGAGRVIFEQEDIEVPTSWSQTALNIAASKYFRGHLGTPERETSVRQLIGRVANTIADWAHEDEYFDAATTEIFRAELTYLLLHQHMAFNSPVWFNVGRDPKPQASACFILSVEDTMESIMDLAKAEAMLFKGGSGAGSNLSRIRGSKERLTGGGTASGPVSFMKGLDAFAGVVKSGGRTRRAAKLICLDTDHPDIEEFITCKADEERKAWALIEQGYDGAFTGEAYGSVFFQNANHSIRASDAFMEAAVDGTSEWYLKHRTSEHREEVSAKDLLRKAAEAAHVCGDPGVQYSDTINDWHTCANTAPIYASNPCSEFLFLDDTACNLASLNLMKFLKRGQLDLAAFRQAVEVTLTAQEVLVSRASYPTPAIAQNSEDYRPLGLGFANLGAALMSKGYAYDSVQAAQWAGAVTALMTGVAYQTSARIAARKGAFNGFEQNREPMMRVMQMHREAAAAYLEPDYVDDDLLAEVHEVWEEVANASSFRNAQVTVLAPTGTISFLMDCDTTGIEPDIALIKYKRLVGGGMLKIVNQTVPVALKALGYSARHVKAILAYLEEHETLEGAPHLKEADLPVFDCAFGKRAIRPEGHLHMMAACQPFISGAISKTVNVPEDATVEDIEALYKLGWELGLKAVAVYRDGSKRSQPLSTRREDQVDNAKGETGAPTVAGPVRRRLPAERASVTHKFAVAQHHGYVTVGLYEDGTPGEIFVTMSKEGSTISGLMDALACAASLALQHGVPLETLTRRFIHTRFEPSGFTGNPSIPMAASVIDYIFRWLDQRFGGTAASTPSTPREAKVSASASASAGLCSTCGALTVRSGACAVCPTCGTTTGCG